MPTATSPPSSRLATRLRRRQHDLLAATDAAGAAVDRQVARRWSALLALLRAEAKRRKESASLVLPHALATQVRSIVHAMHAETTATIQDRLTGIVHHAYATDVSLLAKTLPIKTLKRAVATQTHTPAHGPTRLFGESRRFLEEPSGRPATPGFVEFPSLASPLEMLDDLPAEEQRDYFSDLLFPPMSIEQAIAILRHPVAGKTWKQDLSQATRLCSPELLLGIISGGFAAGQNPREIAALLRPAVAGVQTSARRVARTYGMQLAHRVQMDAHAGLGDMVIGYTIHSAKSPNSRWWHRERDGTRYFLEPGPGQKGMDQCPHPPLEAEDPSERPAGTPHLAFNCLCWLSPILSD